MPDTPPSEVDLISTIPGFLIIMPVHNEAESIERVLTDFHDRVATPLGAEILVCEDGSTDGTRKVLQRLARNLPFRYLSDSRRLGYEKSVKRALRLARDDVLFSDSDGQYRPKDLWRLLNEADGFDMVIGRKVKREESLYRIILWKGFHFLVKLLFGMRLHDIDCGFRLVKQHVIQDTLDLVRDLPFSFWAEFTIIASRRGHKIREIPISHRRRLHGGTTIYQPKKLPRIMLAQFLGLVRLRRRINTGVKGVL